MDTYTESLRRLMLATSKIDGAYYFFARRMGVNENAMAFYYALADGKPHTQKAICDEMLIPRTTINSIVKAALAQGYITISPRQNSKEKDIVLTASGQIYADAMVKQIYKAEEQAIQETLRHFSPEFITAIEYFSQRLCLELQSIQNKEDDSHEQL